MSSNDVPGFNPKNSDSLSMGCWAQHEDGSLILVESVEGNRVIFSMFDRSREPIVEYRDAMPENEFKKRFSFDPNAKGGTQSIRWTWRDKTLFPWDLIIKDGAQVGERPVSAADILTAAQRVADSLNMRAREFKPSRFDGFRERTIQQVGTLRDKLSRALNELKK